MVLWFYGFVALWFYGCVVPWFYGFLVSKMYQLSISCFLEDIDLRSKIFKISLKECSSLFGARLFHDRTKMGFRHLYIYTNNIFRTCVHKFLYV